MTHAEISFQEINMNGKLPIWLPLRLFNGFQRLSGAGFLITHSGEVVEASNIVSQFQVGKKLHGEEPLRPILGASFYFGSESKKIKY